MMRQIWSFAAAILCFAVSISYGASLPINVGRDCAANVILVIDKSGSMSGSYSEVLQFAKAIISGFDPRSRVGIVTFNSNAQIEVQLGGYADKAELRRKIDGLPRPGGGTSIYMGILQMHEMFRADSRFADKSNNRFTAIIITDGQDSSFSRLQAASSAAHSDGINIICLGVGSVNVPQIQAMASDPDFALIRPTTKQIGELYDKVIKYTCEAVRPGVRHQVDECFRTNYTHGQLWLPYRQNCHQYIVCQPISPGKYIKHIMTCGALYWNQKIHGCTREKSDDCEVGTVVTYTGPPPTDGPCPYKRDSRSPITFYSVNDPRETQDCPQGQEFSEDKCTCIVAVGQVVQACSNDLLLHFDFENDFNDVTCHKAVANKYGDGTVLSLSDAERNSNVARFDGRGYLEVPFIRTWFANNHVDAFTISLWYNRLGRSVGTFGALVNNGDDVENAGFALRVAEHNQLIGSIRTENGEKSVTVNVPATSNGWHHVVFVYDGQQMSISVDRSAANAVAISGYMVNNDVPMNVGFDSQTYFFDGLMDELRIYTRALTAAETTPL